MIEVGEELFWIAYKEAMGTDEVDLMGELSNNMKDWLRTNIINEKFSNFIIKNPFSNAIQLCANYFYGPELIIKWTDEYASIKKDYILIGSASNGDLLLSQENLGVA